MGAFLPFCFSSQEGRPAAPGVSPQGTRPEPPPSSSSSLSLPSSVNRKEKGQKRDLMYRRKSPTSSSVYPPPIQFRLPASTARHPHTTPKTSHTRLPFCLVHTTRSTRSTDGTIIPAYIARAPNSLKLNVPFDHGSNCQLTAPCSIAASAGLLV